MLELRHALRVLVARQGFSIVAPLTLALGIGANTARWRCSLRFTVRRAGRAGSIP